MKTNNKETIFEPAALWGSLSLRTYGYGYERSSLEVCLFQVAVSNHIILTAAQTRLSMANADTPVTTKCLFPESEIGV